jgi:hypothetical protein
MESGRLLFDAAGGLAFERSPRGSSTRARLAERPILVEPPHAFGQQRAQAHHLERQRQAFGARHAVGDDVPSRSQRGESLSRGADEQTVAAVT